MAERLYARTSQLSWRDVRVLFERWCAEIASHPSYLRIEGRPLCTMLNLSDFDHAYGLTTLQVLVRFARRVIRDQLGVDAYLVGVIGQADIRNVAIANALPFDGVTGYGLLPNWLDEPVQSYAELVVQRTSDWEELQGRLRMPFFPVVCSGWDASVRGERRECLTGAEGYPHTPVVQGATPKLFELFLEQARSFNARHMPRPPLIFLHAWNEWTEGAVLEPSDRHQFRFLDAIRMHAVTEP